MQADMILLTIVFSGIFLILTLLYKIISAFKKEMCGKFTRLELFFVNHVHADDGTAYVPRKQAAK